MKLSKRQKIALLERQHDSDQRVIACLSGENERMSNLCSKLTSQYAAAQVENLSVPIPVPIGTMVFRKRGDISYTNYPVVEAVRYTKSMVAQEPGKDFFLTFEEAENYIVANPNIVCDTAQTAYLAQGGQAR